MDEDCAKIQAPTANYRTYENAAEGHPMRLGNPQKILDIAKRIQQFVDDNGWSWCDLDQVYHILKVCNR